MVIWPEFRMGQYSDHQVHRVMMKLIKKRLQVQMLLILLSILFSRDLLMLPLRLVKWLLPHKR